MNSGLDTYREQFEIFPQFIGKSLVSLKREQYLFNGQADDDDDGALELLFTDNSVLTIRVANNGESVIASGEPIDLTEKFKLEDGSTCDWRFVDLSEVDPWSSLCACPLTGVQAIFEQMRRNESSQKYIIGWVIWFNRSFICYYNNGDAGKLLFNKMPPKLQDCDMTYESIE